MRVEELFPLTPSPPPNNLSKQTAVTEGRETTEREENGGRGWVGVGFVDQENERLKRENPFCVCGGEN